MDVGKFVVDDVEIYFLQIENAKNDDFTQVFERFEKRTVSFQGHKY
jgi:hypothetical protein